MKFDLNCVRQILFKLEEYPFISEDKEGNLVFKELTAEQLSAMLPDENKPCIIYALLKLEEAGYINAISCPGDDTLDLFAITSLTYSGHELIESLRPEPVWKKAASALTSLGCSSLSLLADVASSVLSSAAHSFLSGH